MGLGPGGGVLEALVSRWIAHDYYQFEFGVIADSGMSVSFQSGSAGSAGTVSQESSPQQQLSTVVKTGNIHTSQLHNLNRSRKLNSVNQSTNL